MTGGMKIENRDAELIGCEKLITTQLELMKRLVADRESTQRIREEKEFLNRVFVRYETIRREMNRGKHLDLDRYDRRLADAFD